MRVLAIDGGGIRGIVPALVLAELEARVGRPVAELFDLVAGTSTGGILACALGRPGARPAAELVDLYRTEGPRIFSRTLGRKITSALGYLDEKYDDTALRATLERYLEPARLSDSLVPLLVTSYDLPSRTPYFFKSWRAKADPDWDFPLAEVARATAAAPTYFEPECITAPDGQELALVDGGVFATNPAMCAFAEARRLDPHAAPFVVSLGTGQLTRPIAGRDAAGWGLLQWVRPLIDVVFDGVADTVEYQLNELAADGDAVRLQVALTRASDALDDASPPNLELLEEQAKDLIKESDAKLDHAVERLLA